MSNDLIVHKPQSQTWYLQRNRAGQKFWDSWMHQDCSFMTSETFYDGFTPFNLSPKVVI